MARAQIRASLLGLAMVLAAAPTAARELELFVESRLGGDSNVFRRADTPEPGSPSPKSAGVFELSPRVTVRDEGDELEYEASYQPTYEQFFLVSGNLNAGDVSGVDHSAIGSLDWAVAPATKFDVDGTFFRQRRIREEIVGIGSPDPALDANDNEYVERVRASTGVTHSLSPRMSLNGRYAYELFNLSEPERADTSAHTLSLGVSRLFSPHLTLGLQGNLRFRDTKVNQLGVGVPVEFRSASRTVDVSASISYEITRHWSVSVSAGPSFITTEDEQSNVEGRETSRSQVSIFAAASTRYRFRQGYVSLVYTRSETGGGGTGAATSIFDNVTAQASYRPADDWELRWSGVFGRRVSLPSDVLNGLETRIDRFNFSLSLIRSFTPRISVRGVARYGTQEQDRFRSSPFVSRTPRSSFIQGFVSLRYTFEPYIF